VLKTALKCKVTPLGYHIIMLPDNPICQTTSSAEKFEGFFYLWYGKTCFAKL